MERILIPSLDGQGSSYHSALFLSERLNLEGCSMRVRQVFALLPELRPKS